MRLFQQGKEDLKLILALIFLYSMPALFPAHYGDLNEEILQNSGG